MRRIQLSNRIFDLGLSNAALCVYSYLCSLQGNRMSNGKTSVKVKQKTIAAACGIGSVQTVAKALAELKTKPVRFTDSVAQDEMPAYVKAKLGIV